MRQPARKDAAMAALDLEVLRKNRHEDTFQASGDADDARWLELELARWLTAHKWQRSRWGEFELVARPAGRGKQLA
jgi:hypothetical protein